MPNFFIIKMLIFHYFELYSQKIYFEIKTSIYYGISL